MNIVEIELLSDDLENTFQFYHQLLQLNVRKKNSDELTFEAGSTLLSFKKSFNEKPQYHFAFNIPVNKIYEALEWVENKVDVITGDDHSKIIDFLNWNSKAFYFYDNNGNILEFIARYDLKFETDDAFTSNSIMSISEIGIVTDDVNATSEELKKQFNIDYFRTANPLNGFAPIGDDNGLFIVVETNRKWYLTDIPATKHWQRIKVIIAGNMVEVTNHQKILG
jgi:catechol-2,3-dioxygenase